MCTLTFVPKKDHFIITSNRDEDVTRGISTFPVELTMGNQELIFPQDPAAGGTWLATSKTHRVLVLLNGAFQKHAHTPPYRKSRGLVVLEAFQYARLVDFEKHYNLDQIEPFTLVSIDIKQKQLEEIRWDGVQKTLTSFDFTQAHIWSSATLYSPKTITQREIWFTDWIKKPNITPTDMLDFHHFGGGKKGENTISMARGHLLKTVSISQIHGTSQSMQFSHHVLLNDTKSNILI
jgi:uncharacterized protein with NRDE domain